MIYVTDFFDALQLFENVAESKHWSTAFKIQAKEVFLGEVEKLKQQINEVDLGEEIPEIIQGVNNALKNL